MSIKYEYEENDDNCEEPVTNWPQAVVKIIEILALVAIVLVMAQCMSEGKIW